MQFLRQPFLRTLNTSTRLQFFQVSRYTAKSELPTLCRTLHASAGRRIQGSQASRARNYYKTQDYPPKNTLLRRFRRFIERIPPEFLVYGIIATNVGIWGIFSYSEMARKAGYPALTIWLRKNMTSSLENFKSGRIWTLVTAAFSHATVDHLLWNSFGLYLFCVGTAATLGSFPFTVVYLGGAVASSAFSLYWHAIQGRRVNSLGASGALCAVMSHMACLAPKSTVHLYGIVPMPLWGVVIGIFAFDMYGALNRTGAGTDFAGHLGGTFAGIALFLARSRLRLY